MAPQADPLAQTQARALLWKLQIWDVEMNEITPKSLIGHNNPPSPFDEVAKDVEDLYGEAKLWLDGATVDSQELADGIGNLTALLRKAEKRADDARKADKQPHLDAGRAVDEQYKPLLEKAKRAIDACKKALAPWLEKIAHEQEESARKAREEAEAKLRAAQEAMKAARSDNLEQRDAAEELAEAAKKAERVAKQAEKQTAVAGGATGKGLHLRTFYTAKITDEQAFARFVWLNRKADLSTFLEQLAQRLVDAKVGSIPGVEIIEERRVA